jgi:membrane protein DedA with SNARE-associated domain
MDHRNIAKYISSITFIGCFITLSLFFYFTSPDTLVSLIGADNAYVMIFFLALIGGLTTFAGVPYHLVLITLAVGGLNPFWLGIITSAGVILGDSTSYYVGARGADILPGRMHDFLLKLISYFMRYPRLLPWFFLFYASFIPLSNDFIVVSMGLAKYPFWKVMIPLAIGNVVFNVLLAYLSVHAYGFIQSVFF